MLRTVHPVPAPIGNYVRPTRRDQRLLLDMLGEERLPTTGLVIDPSLWGLHEELGSEAAGHGLEVVIDPHALELSTPGGFGRAGLRELPWAGERPHEPADLRGPGGPELIDRLLDFVEGKPFTACLTPTHFLERVDSDWLDVDMALAQRMRAGLDARGHAERPLYYLLAAHSKVIRDPSARRRLIERLRALDVDGLWLKVHPFGATASGPLALRGYIEAARDFHALGVPIVGDRTGTLGVALAAFGALGGIEAGVTLGERFDVGSLTRPRTGRAFAPAPRVYLRELGVFISRDQARHLLGQRGMKAAFGCQLSCCRRGAVDMIDEPRKHYLITRGGELGSLSSMPEPLRAGRYLEEFLRPASDLAVRAARALPALESHRKRLDGWRETLGALHARDVDSAITYSRAPDGSRISRRLGA